MDSAITGFSQRVLRYFLTFLETDFKRQQAPRRRIQLKTETGFRSGMPLRKYPKLYETVWKLAEQTVAEGLTVRIPRGRYTSPISPTLRDLIRKQVAELPPVAFARVCGHVLDSAARHRGNAVDNPEKFVEDVQLAFVEQVGEQVVAPVLALLDGPFRQQSYSAIESVYEVESDLTDALTAATLAQLPMAVNTFIVKGDPVPMRAVLEEFFSEKEVKERVVEFFEDFATADAFQELRDLMNFARTADNLQLYLYLCELRFGTASYPLFYVPVSVRFDEDKSEYVVDCDPHLFVNKRAIDYVLQERKGESARLPVSPVDDRIVYLDESGSFLGEMESVFRKLVPVFEIVSDIDLRTHRMQSASSPSLKVANTSYFAVFDKSDEALLNDYEELLTAVTEDQQGAGAMFENIIRGFLVEEPKSARGDVEAAWDATKIVDRLVAVSPIPVNEEQRKILTALRHPDCHYLAIQGPPGTGKSHTITAIAFDCILSGKNVLILSDKQEALDVVQDKLETALASVRHGGDDFPNPILRLGRTGGSYARLISQASQEKIRQHYRAQKSNAQELETEAARTESELKQGIQRTIDAYASVRLTEIEELHRLEATLKRVPGEFATRFQAPEKPQFLPQLQQTLVAFACDDWKSAVDYLSAHAPSGRHPGLVTACRIYAAALRLADLRREGQALSLFTALGPEDQLTLVSFIAEFENLRWPILGWLFQGANLRAVNSKVGQALPCTNNLELHKRLRDLKILVGVLARIREVLGQEHLEEKHGRAVYRLLASGEDLPPGISRVKQFLAAFLVTFGQTTSSELLASDRFHSIEDLLAFMQTASRYSLLWQSVTRTLATVPALDYVGSKGKLERLHAVRMAQEIDRRFLDFVEGNRTTAKTLGGVIKAKQQFPQEEFSKVKEAFPCIIAGIREFAEYVPLKQEIFDLVVIDEASQVSVAQAFPALLRAKKVIVFGDQKQFSNVKSAQASNMLNAAHLTDIEAYFRANVSKAADKIQRLKHFDVKKSILEFFDLISSYTDMLRKHFRGYQELISFSSLHFYGGELQAIKVRGKPLDEVIRFDVLEPDGRQEKYRNVNSKEADFILAELHQMVDDEEEHSVGIITPFREQMQHLTRILFNDAYADRFESRLKLKIMTFDTCQGEERDVIFYSMVATPTHDVLNYVFPVDLANMEERVEEALKVQRLNVGFSRAKECIRLVLSKPVDQFHGSIGRALAHYWNLLLDKAPPKPEQTDPASPMEKKVLDWLLKSAFYQNHEEEVELIPQFPIGDYLRQLDKFYEHPAYRCDFLLRYYGESGTVNIVIEYDGFAEHFVEHKKIHEGNYDQYYRPADIERQMVIESYGYKFLRLNRFNLGRDPIATLSTRLSELIHGAVGDEEPVAVRKIRGDAEGLANGDSKHCRKCDQVKELESFRDPTLKNGKGGVGQICLDCKRKTKVPKNRWGGRSRGRYYW